MHILTYKGLSLSDSDMLAIAFSLSHQCGHSKTPCPLRGHTLTGSHSTQDRILTSHVISDKLAVHPTADNAARF